MSAWHCFQCVSFPQPVGWSRYKAFRHLSIDWIGANTLGFFLVSLVGLGLSIQSFGLGCTILILMWFSCYSDHFILHSFSLAGINSGLTYFVHNQIPGIAKVCFWVDFKDFLSLSCFVLPSLSSFLCIPVTLCTSLMPLGLWVGMTDWSNLQGHMVDREKTWYCHSL